MKDSFSKLHPITNMLFFVFAITFSMFINHPVCIAISLITAGLTAVYLNGKQALLFSLRFLLPLIILTAVINPVFNHRGATIIEYLPWGNPLTLESVIYGLTAAVLLSSAALWFSCFHKVMTSDKFVYLFGRVIPSLSLVLSMALRFVPRFNAQLKLVRKAQKAIGRDMSDGTILLRIKNGVKILSLMITWSLENAIDTSDSMKSRGYGLKGRTSFSIFKFTKKDACVLIAMLAEAAVIIVLLFLGFAKFRYFPTIKGSMFGAGTIVFYAVYSLFLLIPLIINIGEGVKWKRLKSAI
ncbi:MAG: energy-coupling factor transporter transmembrane component T [Ruminococcus sp.]|nr:energy-coupling factor transporter transmembrane component T [Ruminococcus sp.]